MKKSKLVFLLLIGLFLAVGLIMAGCDAWVGWHGSNCPNDNYCKTGYGGSKCKKPGCAVVSKGGIDKGEDDVECDCGYW